VRENGENISGWHPGDLLTQRKKFTLKEKKKLRKNRSQKQDPTKIKQVVGKRGKGGRTRRGVGGKTEKEKAAPEEGRKGLTTGGGSKVVGAESNETEKSLPEAKQGGTTKKIKKLQAWWRKGKGRLVGGSVQETGALEAKSVDKKKKKSMKNLKEA